MDKRERERERERESLSSSMCKVRMLRFACAYAALSGQMMHNSHGQYFDLAGRKICVATAHIR